MNLLRPAPIALALLVLAGCKSAPAPRVAGPSACHDGEYRGVLTSSNGESQRFRMSARFCPAGTSLLEFRGVIGGAGLIAGVRTGEAVRLVFPQKRLAIDGPDRPAFWQKYTGTPLDGRLIRTLATGSGTATVGDWTADVAAAPAGDALPAGVTASDAAGHRLELHKKSEKAAAEDAAWPAVPAGFEHRVEDATPATETP